MAFTGEKINLYNYEKHDGKKFGETTGIALCLNTSPYVVIDIDINKKIDEPRREEIRESFIAAFCQECKIVKTTSGGLHLYCSWDNSVDGLTKNDYTKIYKCDDYDIDVFIPVIKENRRLVVIPPSKVKNHFGEIGTYELIADINDNDLIPFKGMRQCLSEAFGVVFDLNNKVKKVEEFLNGIDEIDIDEDDIMNDIDNKECSLELFNKIIEGFNGLEIHNDSIHIKDEITLPILFKSILACENDEITMNIIEEKCDYIFDNAKLTDNG